MNTHFRLRQLMAERNWTAYRLAKESGLSESTLANIFKRNTVPSIATLEAVCSAFASRWHNFSPKVKWWN